MVWIYFDASALVKRYSEEEGSRLLLELFQQLTRWSDDCEQHRRIRNYLCFGAQTK